mmetsp:Transcript_27803/g.60967  ORF Transcript_27803/g.60967 Transcript_27803/m.60967 type:complete len:211 (-) Transcript_27803:542-1174(-)
MRSRSPLQKPGGRGPGSCLGCDCLACWVQNCPLVYAYCVKHHALHPSFLHGVFALLLSPHRLILHLCSALCMECLTQCTMRHMGVPRASARYIHGPALSPGGAGLLVKPSVVVQGLGAEPCPGDPQPWNPPPGLGRGTCAAVLLILPHMSPLPASCSPFVWTGRYRGGPPGRSNPAVVQVLLLGARARAWTLSCSSQVLEKFAHRLVQIH